MWEETMVCLWPISAFVYLLSNQSERVDFYYFRLDMFLIQKLTVVNSALDGPGFLIFWTYFNEIP